MYTILVNIAALDVDNIHYDSIIHMVAYGGNFQMGIVWVHLEVNEIVYAFHVGKI